MKKLFPSLLISFSILYCSLYCSPVYGQGACPIFDVSQDNENDGGYSFGLQVLGDYMVWHGRIAGSWEVYLYQISQRSKINISQNLGEPDGNATLSESHVVWRGWDGNDWEIYLYDIENQTKINISQNDNNSDYEARIYGNFVVWHGLNNSEDYEIFLYDIANQTKTNISQNPIRDDKFAVIHGNHVVWEGNIGDGNIEVFLYNIANQTKTNISQNDTGADAQADIFGNYVVYRAGEGNGTEILLYNIETGQKINISQNEGQSDYRPFVSGNYVVWRAWDGDGEIYGYDILNATKVTLSNNEDDDDNHHIYEHSIVWESRVNGFYDIYHYDFLTNITTNISQREDFSDVDPFIWNNYITWQGNHGSHEIYLYDLDFQIPDAPILDDINSTTTLCTGEKAALIIQNQEIDEEIVWFDDAQMSTELYASAVNEFQPTVMESTSFFGAKRNISSGCLSDLLEVKVTVDNGIIVQKGILYCYNNKQFISFFVSGDAENYQIINHGAGVLSQSTFTDKETFMLYDLEEGEEWNITIQAENNENCRAILSGNVGVCEDNILSECTAAARVYQYDQINIGSLSVSDRYVVWSAIDDTVGDYEIWMSEIGLELQPQNISLNPTGNDRSPQAEGDYIVWGGTYNDNNEIFLYQFGSNLPARNISQNLARSDSKPQISGNYIVWESTLNNNTEVFAYQINGNASAFNISNRSNDDINPQISGNFVVWEAKNLNAGSSTGIYFYDLENSVVAENIMTTASSSPHNLRIKGTTVAWSDYSSTNNSDDIFLYKINSSLMPQNISNSANIDRYPEVSERYVVWLSSSTNETAVFLYDTETETEVRNIASQIERHDTKPKIFDNYIIWDNEYEVWMYDLNHEDKPAEAISDNYNLRNYYPQVHGNFITWQSNDRYSNDETSIWLYDLSLEQPDRPILDETNSILNGTCPNDDVELVLNNLQINEEAVWRNQLELSEELYASIENDFQTSIIKNTTFHAQKRNVLTGCTSSVMEVMTELSEPISIVEGANYCNNNNELFLPLSINGTSPSYNIFDGNSGTVSQLQVDAQEPFLLFDMNENEEWSFIVQAENTPNCLLNVTGLSSNCEDAFAANCGVARNISENDRSDNYPAISGNIAVWASYGDIYYRDLKRPLSEPINISASYLQYSNRPQISGKYVVWEGYDGLDEEIWFYEIGSEVAPRNISKNFENVDREPQISGNNVVWRMEDNGHYDIGFYRIGIDEEAHNISDITNSSSRDNFAPKVTKKYVMWNGYDENDIEIWLYEIGVDTIPQNISQNDGKSDVQPQIYENQVIWVSDTEEGVKVLLYEIGANQPPQHILQDYERNSSNIQIFDKYITFRSSPFPHSVWLYELGTNIPPQEISDRIEGEHTFPSINGEYVAWRRRFNSNYEVWVYKIGSETPPYKVSENFTTGHIPILNGQYLTWLEGEGSETEIYLYDLALSPPENPILDEANSIISISSDESATLILQNISPYEEIVWLDETQSSELYASAGNQFEPVLNETTTFFGAKRNMITGCTSSLIEVTVTVENELPLDWLSFTAKLNQDIQVELNWQTANEMNHDFFTIERSSNQTSFSPIGKIHKKEEASKYFFLDKKPVSGVNYYRIKQTDKNGKESFSIIKPIEVITKKIYLYPNPVQNELSVNLNDLDVEEVVLKIYNAQGKEVFNSNISVFENVILLDLNQEKVTTSGVYWVKIWANDQQLAVDKFIKMD